MDKRDSNLMAMRLFATWDVDRATPSTVPRIFNVSINRIVLDGLPSQLNSIVVTAKLPLAKRNRSLRSNEIKIVAHNGRIDLDCDITFSIQYPHFLKRKPNNLQLVIQRRRKYKNRLPGGFKDLASGVINLTNVMQQGGLREVALNAADGEMELKGAGLCVGRMILTSCYSQAPEHIDDRDKGKKGTEDTEDETESDYDDVALDDLTDIPSGRSDHRHKDSEIDDPRRRRNKNFKQKFAKLIRRFNKMPSEEVVAEVASTSGARPPTAKELEALFDELSDFSDSGPEMMNDDISICSNPRPCLQPFFARSREVLPAIYDGHEVDATDSEAERDECEWSSEDNGKENRLKLAQKDSYSETTPKRDRFMRTETTSLPHSTTLNSMGKVVSCDSGRANLLEQLGSILGASMSSTGDVIWLCNVGESASFGELGQMLPLVNCPSSVQVRQTMSHIVNRIQTFCHSNSDDPPMTSIGIIGHDQLFTRVLRAYVECLAHKSSSNWLRYIQFLPVPSTSSLFYRHIEGMDRQLDGICRDLWERLPEMNQNEKLSAFGRLTAWGNNHNVSRMSLPIGEAMLQLTVADREPEGGRIFVPFLSEVRVGNAQYDAGTDEDSGGGNVTSPREEKETSCGSMGKTDGSPPQSPGMRKNEGQELSIDFLINNPLTSGNVIVNESTTPKKSEMKAITVKAHFKTMIVSRQLSNGQLSLTYLKEKKKEKMLQKLGMKKGQKQKMENESSPTVIASIGRMLCSASGKHNELTIIVDGSAYTGIRYFQVIPQWQTHVKSFPIALMSNVYS